jgi:hypothetical protein
MHNVIPFPTNQNKRFRLNQAAAAKVGAYVCLRPAPSESPADFVARIVTQYHAELDGQAGGGQVVQL